MLKLNVGQLPTCAFAFISVFHYFMFPGACLFSVGLYIEKGSLIKSLSECLLGVCSRSTHAFEEENGMAFGSPASLLSLVAWNLFQNCKQVLL